jgi:hypothetical protein
LELEQLEQRLFPCTPLNVLGIINAVNAGSDAEQYDVNRDGMVSPLDALLAINEVNRLATVPQTPTVIHPAADSWHTLPFSQCGSDAAITVLASTESPDITLAIGDDVYQPTGNRPFGAYIAYDFAVWGQGYEWLRVSGVSDELLTVIVG